MTRQFLSFSLPVGYGVSPKQLVRLIQQADRLGLPGVAVGELTSTDALALLAAAAPVTSSIRLETSVVSVLTRSPSLLAMSAATLADLSDDRFVLGLGAGSPIVAGFHGQPFVEPVERVERWIAAVRAALGGATLAEWGSFRLRGIDPAPVPILVAAMNPKMLTVAAEHGDGVILNLCGPAQVAQLAGRALEHRAAAGVERPFEVHTTLWADATGDPDRAYERFKTEMAPYLAVSTYRAAVVALSDEESIDRAAAAWRERGRSAAATLFPDSIATAMVATDAADLAAKATALRDAGCTGVRVTSLTHEAGAAEHASRVVELLADAQSRMA